MKDFFGCNFSDARKQAVRDSQIADRVVAVCVLGGAVGVFVRSPTDLVGSEMATTFYAHTVTPGVPFIRIARRGNISGRVSRQLAAEGESCFLIVSDSTCMPHLT